MTLVLKCQSSNKLQRKDVVNLMRKVAKQWQLRNNGRLTHLPCQSTMLLMRLLVEVTTVLLSENEQHFRTCGTPD